MRWNICKCNSTCYEHRTVSGLVCLAPGAEVEARNAHLKRLQVDVVVKTFCN